MAIYDIVIIINYNLYNINYINNHEINFFMNYVVISFPSKNDKFEMCV